MGPGGFRRKSPRSPLTKVCSGSSCYKSLKAARVSTHALPKSTRFLRQEAAKIVSDQIIALLWENHEHHQTARGWLRRATDFPTCPQHSGSPLKLAGGGHSFVLGDVNRDGKLNLIVCSGNSHFAERGGRRT